ncbi:methyltransferase domain-containing protein [Desulfosarcina sp.]|uniref:methyltransferase domain-containing protein n=1 Tax=Desulfosarcina sp. TaxID=2027861 RepID=UPI003561864B
MRLNASINLFALSAIILIGAILFLFVSHRITIDMDTAGPLSTNELVIADGLDITTINPVMDPIAIDIGSVKGDLERLVAAAEMVDNRMKQSDLFAPGQHASMQQGLADLTDWVRHHLPVLFTAGELAQQVAPLLTDEAIRQALTKGGTDPFRTADPLSLHQIILARLDALNPTPGATIHRGRFLSADRRHLLILAASTGPTSDTTVAHTLTVFFRDLEEDLKQNIGGDIVLTVAGAFRTTLDNPTIAKRDVGRAIRWTAVGIGALLLIGFSHPLTGMLALMPAMVGTVTAVFIFSLGHDSISIMALGLGSIVVSIATHHGIAYMLFVASGSENGAGHASREIRAIGLPAALTAIVAFGAMAASGVAVFEPLGWVAAMGLGLSLLFVHTVFPRILTVDPHRAAPTEHRFPRFLDRLFSAGWIGLALALLTAVVLALFIRPQFATDIKAMGSPSRETRAADELITRVWGDIFSSVYLVTEANDLTALQEKNDRLLERLETEAHAGRIENAMTPSLFWPGPSQSEDNVDAWNQFWAADQFRKVSAAVNREAAAAGFDAGAFAPFFTMIATASPTSTTIPPSVQTLLGIHSGGNDGRWRQVTRITPREHFDSQRFNDRISDLSSVFVPAHLSQRVKKRLRDGLVAMLLIIGAGLIFVLTPYLADMGLLFMTLLPPAFAFFCTLGTLGMLGRPPNLSALMVMSAVLMGAGVYLPLLLVRGYQRYQRFDDPDFSVVRTALFMTAGCTLVAAAALWDADHDLLKSAGQISFFGVGYCLVGTLLILPPLLKRRFDAPPPDAEGIARRCRHMAPCPRLSAHDTQQADALLSELATLVPEKTVVANILDVGCGYGGSACWMAEHYPGAIIHGIDPQPERVRVAALSLGDRGRITRGSAPELPAMDVLLDLATMLDASHFLQDWELEKTLEGIHERLLPGGRLIMRSLLPRSTSPHWTRRLGHVALGISRRQAYYRSQAAISNALDKCGFDILTCLTSGNRTDMIWHVSKPR